MKPTTFSFSQRLKRFFEPLSKHPYLILMITAFIVATLYIGLAELVRQNLYDTQMLSAELLIELGPDFAEASKDYAEMAQLYVDHQEERYFASLLRLLYPEYSPKKLLAPALSALEKAAQDKKEGEAKEAIWQAGLASNQLYMRGKRFPRSPIEWFKSEVVSERLLADLDDAFDTTHELVNKLEKEQSVEFAVAACRANRKTILLLFLARSCYDNEEKIKRFLSDLKRSRDCALVLAERTEKEKQEFLYQTARCQDLRIKILEAILYNDNDMDRVCELLREVIEKAYGKRDVLP